MQALAPGGALAAHVPRFTPREGQQDLAGQIADAIETAGALVAEAGTGTGKTFAYLVPALLSGGRVMIATGTRTLQDQLFERDLPRVREALGVAAQIALLKGRSNYVCLYHLGRNLTDGRFAKREDVADLRRIELFSKVTVSGDRAAMSAVAEDAPAWALATSTRENCLGQECPDHGRCFVFKARQAAQQADIVVVNHHLFCADLMLRDEGISELLPTTSTLIFDEAHQLPEVATQFFGSSVSTRQLVEFSRDALRSGLADARDSADWTALSGQMEQSVRELRLHAGTPGRLDVAAIRGRPALLSAIVGCATAVGVLGSALDAASQRGRDVARCALRAAEIQQRLYEWLADVTGQPRVVAAIASPAADPLDDAIAQLLADGAAQPGAIAGQSELVPGLVAGSTVPTGAPSLDEPAAAPVEAPIAPDARILWADISNYGCTLHSTPLSVAGVFRRHRAQTPRAWVFLSATLAVGGTLDHYARLMGLEDAQHHVWPSPFDFASQGLLYVPEGLGDPGQPVFGERMVEAIWPLIQANRGRTFVLCTTLRMVERAAGLLAQKISDAGEPFELLQQGKSSRAELLERFRQHAAPVLVGSASFWEGVDVQGEQLSLVVIDKLPFAPPDDPIVRARAQAARQRGLDPFRHQHLPAAAMSLKQGAGRLIRSEDDRGLLVVCDERLATKPYGRSLLKSLPPFRRTRSQAEALTFLQGVPAAPISTPATSSGCLPGSPGPSAGSSGS